MFQIVNGALSGINSNSSPLFQQAALPNAYQQWAIALEQPFQGSEEQTLRLEEMKLRHEEVVAHEEAHAAVGGSFAGAPSYTFEIGPDGEGYAVAGEVPIDMSEIAGDPHGTYDKMLVVQAAALAPAEPSGQDMNVAGQASVLADKALNDIHMMEVGSLESGGFIDDVFKPSSIFGQPLFG